MTRLPFWGFAAAFALQAGLLIWMVADRALVLSEGREIRLAVRPVDPRDFFRGDYVILTYDVSQLDPRNLGGDDDFNAGDTIYVSLRREGAVWSASAINHEITEDGADIFLRGVVGRVDATVDCDPPCSRYQVDYGLEQFFVPEGEGRALEQLRNDQKLAVDVAVDSDGRGALKRMLVDGEVRYETGL